MAGAEVEKLSGTREGLLKEISAFNARNNLTVFRLEAGDEGLEFTGTLRFYFLSHGQEIAKVVRLNSAMTTADLMPVLVEKFGAYIPKEKQQPEHFSLLMASQNGEQHLRGRDSPLQLTLLAKLPPRFILQHAERRLIKTSGLFSPVTSTDSLNSTSSGPSERGSTPAALDGRTSFFSRSQSSINDSDDSADVTTTRHIESPQLPANSSRGAKKFLRTIQKTMKAKNSRKSLILKEPKRPSGYSSERKMSIGSTSSQTNAIRIFSGPSLLELSGSEYKVVASSEVMTAHELIAATLLRHHLDDEQPEDFVLCDTVGHLESYSRQSGETVSAEQASEEDVAFRFVAHYSRLVHPSEHPLLIMQVWQPEANCEQRFVLHPRTAVPPFCPFVTFSQGETQSLSHASSVDTLHDAEGCALLTLTQHHKVSSKQLPFSSVLTDNIDVPFLITLTCEKPEDSLLVYMLNDKVTTIGRTAPNNRKFSRPENLSIALCSKDVKALHCCIRCTEYIAAGQVRHFVYTLEPVKNAAVAINGKIITNMATLASGDLIQIGRHHAFVYRDLAKPVGVDDGWSWLPKPEFAALQEEDDQEESQLGSSQQSLDSSRRYSDSSESDVSAMKGASPKKLDRPPAFMSRESSSSSLLSIRKELSEKPTTPTSRFVGEVSDPEKKRQLRFNYSFGSIDIAEDKDDSSGEYRTINLSSEQHEDVFLHLVLNTAEISTLPTPLVSSACVCLALRTKHANTSNDDMPSLSRFITKISEHIQEGVWQSSNRLEQHKPALAQEGDPLGLLHSILPDVQDQVIWMANALEVFHCVHQVLHQRGADVGQLTLTPPSSLPTDGAEAVEAMSLLQEVIVYSFQQVLYPATRLVYTLLPAILDENPFEVADARSNGELSLSEKDCQAVSQVERLTELLQVLVDLMNVSGLHSNITLQLLSNLLFFINASLFNTLMEDDGGQLFYSWKKAIQIRSNLDTVEGWTSQLPGEIKEAIRHLDKMSLATDLLATQQQQLVEMSWSRLREEFNVLNPAQLHQLLQNYQLEGNVKRPDEWQPTANEEKQANLTDQLLEGILEFTEAILDKMAGEGLPMTTVNGATNPPNATKREVTAHSSDMPADSLQSDTTSAASAEFQQEPTAANGTAAHQRGAKEENLTACGSYSFNSLEAISETDEPISGNATPVLQRQQSGPRSKSSTAVSVGQGEHLVADMSSLNKEQPCPPSIEISAEQFSDAVEEEHRAEEMSMLKPLTMSKYSASVRSLHDTDVDNLMLRAVELLGSDSEESLREADDLLVEVLSKARDFRHDDDDVENSNGKNVNVDSGQDVSLSRVKKSGDFITATLTKNEKGLGLGVIDGKLLGVNPGVYISNLVPGLAAAECGKLQPGDKILAINGTNLMAATQDEAYRILRKAGDQIVVFAVRDQHICKMVSAASC